jgi:putative DNA methylase
MTFTTEGHTPVLIEDWLPIRELSIESVRERQAASALPPLSFLHVWWARAPLAAANGVTLASLLPMWDNALLGHVDGLPEALERLRFNRQDLASKADEMSPTKWYRTWVLWMCGVWGDAIAANRRIEAATARGERLGSSAYGWKQAYKNKPSTADLNVLHRLLIHRWGHLPRVGDPTAGGGSIPYTSLRYGLPTWANDLNPVAVGVLDATLRASSVYGEDLVPDIKKWGGMLVDRLRERLAPFFIIPDDATNNSYVYANTVACPRTGGPVPLSPNWWLSKANGGIAVRMEAVSKPDGSPDRLEFHIEAGPDFSFDPDDGTVARGDATSPWDGLVIEGDYLKAEAQAGRMWATLYAVACGKPRAKGRGLVRYFRSPASEDLDGLRAAAQELAGLESRWAAEDILPTEEFPPPIPKHDIRPYGFLRWRDFFTDRQLLVHGVFIEEWRRLKDEVVGVLGEDRGGEVMTLLAMMQGKATNWNSRLSSWDTSRQKMRSVFERHDFAFKWTFAEFEGAREMWPFCLSQLLYAYEGKVSFEGVARLIQPVTDDGLYATELLEHAVPGEITLSAGSAASMPDIQDGAIELVNIDPPYYDNVQYAELADFFYVWEKRTLGLLHPERFADELTNKDDEAVANVARFADAGRRKSELATFDYQQKMQAIFAECHRVLVDDGVMVVWFTHKKAEAWDTLATAMMEAGFTIEASWPVATQPVVASNHAKKNSAKSTIMLVCRKRASSNNGDVFFDDIETDLRQAARDAVEKFEAEVGIGGVDLQLATYGPTLSVISRNWPVLSSETDEVTGRSRVLRPEEALNVARQEVGRLRMARLLGGRQVRFDAATDFWLLCWDTFQAREFPYDEARKLAFGIGYDVDQAVTDGLLTKKSGNVTMVEPTKRARALRRKMDDTGRFERLADALAHLLAAYDTDGLAAARTWLGDSGYGSEQAFTDVVQGAVNAVPRVRTKMGLSLEEARLLEDAVVALFGDEIGLPTDRDVVEADTYEQPSLG